MIPDAETVKACLAVIGNSIAVGPLQGNGCDATAERNGLILASNLLSGMLPQAPGLDHSEYRLVPSRASIFGFDVVERADFDDGEWGLTIDGKLHDEIQQAYYEAYRGDFRQRTMRAPG